METTKVLLGVIDEVLGLKERGIRLTAESSLLDTIPGLDSMAVVALIERIETQFDIAVADTDIDGSVFRTVDSLRAFIEQQLPA